ncbi:uncharacterized protein LOC131672953 [Phymastichus coffea]|uniref:uncharacterized protein LOC131672953 n=1 Tax=Phymastichus coffea TaxID=108790 RepID=UPI00273AA06F|nr:uncharacterized protein LOC131672953 [Phymastichus coffea]
MKKVLQVFAVLIAIIVGSNSTKIEKCKAKDSPKIKDLEVNLEDCTGTDGRCILNRGQTYNFEQKFKSPKNVDNLEAVATASVFKQPVQITSADDSNACQNISDMNGKKGCPLKKGKSYVYKKLITIKKDEIWANMNMQFHLKSGNNTITCFGLPIRVQEKKE